MKRWNECSCGSRTEKNVDSRKKNVGTDSSTAVETRLPASSRKQESDTGTRKASAQLVLKQCHRRDVNRRMHGTRPQGYSRWER